MQICFANSFISERAVTAIVGVCVITCNGTFRPLDICFYTSFLLRVGFFLLFFTFCAHAHLLFWGSNFGFVVPIFFVFLFNVGVIHFVFLLHVHMCCYCFFSYCHFEGLYSPHPVRKMMATQTRIIWFRLSVTLVPGAACRRGTSRAAVVNENSAISCYEEQPSLGGQSGQLSQDCIRRVLALFSYCYRRDCSE